MKVHRIAIVGMRTLSSGASPWGNRRFDSTGRWREVVLLLERDVVCESCGRAFTQSFRAVTQSTVSQGHSQIDSAGLTTTVEQVLQRRLCCPYCHTPQRRVRHRLLARNLRHNLVGVGAIGGSITGAVALGGGGYAVAGDWGLLVGLGLATLLALTLTRWMLARLLDRAV